VGNPTDFGELCIIGESGGLCKGINGKMPRSGLNSQSWWLGPWHVLWGSQV
jgi:hypothetical protein